MIIIGLEACQKCKMTHKIYSNLTYIEIPKISLGFGDTISKITNFFGIKTCGQCRLRQYKFNKWIPYFWRKKKINPDILKAKNLAYKHKITDFPILASDDLESIINNPYEQKNIIYWNGNIR